MCFWVRAASRPEGSGFAVTSHPGNAEELLTSYRRTPGSGQRRHPDAPDAHRGGAGGGLEAGWTGFQQEWGFLSSAVLIVLIGGAL